MLLYQVVNNGRTDVVNENDVIKLELIPEEVLFKFFMKGLSACILF